MTRGSERLVLDNKLKEERRNRCSFCFLPEHNCRLPLDVLQPLCCLFLSLRWHLASRWHFTFPDIQLCQLKLLQHFPDAFSTYAFKSQVTTLFLWHLSQKADVSHSSGGNSEKCVINDNKTQVPDASHFVKKGFCFQCFSSPGFTKSTRTEIFRIRTLILVVIDQIETFYSKWNKKITTKTSGLHVVDTADHSWMFVCVGSVFDDEAGSLTSRRSSRRPSVRPRTSPSLCLRPEPELSPPGPLKLTHRKDIINYINCGRDMTAVSCLLMTTWSTQKKYFVIQHLFL